MALVGLPPKDLLEDVAQAFCEKGLDPDECFARACDVTQEWQYDRSAFLLRDRFKQRFVSERAIPLKQRMAGSVLGASCQSSPTTGLS